MEDPKRRITAARACSHAFIVGDGDSSAQKTGTTIGLSSATRRLPKTSSQPAVSFPPNSPTAGLPKSGGLGGAGGSALALASRRDESSSTSSSTTVLRPKSSTNMLPTGNSGASTSSVGSPPGSRTEREPSLTGDHSYMSSPTHGDMRKTSNSHLSGGGNGLGVGAPPVQPARMLNESDLMQSLLNINLNMTNRSKEREGSISSPPAATGSGVLSPTHRVSLDTKHSASMTPRGSSGSSMSHHTNSSSSHHPRKDSGNVSARTSSDVPSLPAINR